MIATVKPRKTVENSLAQLEEQSASMNPDADRTVSASIIAAGPRARNYVFI